jgi:predicted metallo-beta-lactamase superfamily hydrolase
VLCFDGFQLDSNLFTTDDIDSEIDITEGSGTYLLANAVLQKEKGEWDVSNMVAISSAQLSKVVMTHPKSKR